jgi:RIP metalloprotease RseP
MAGVVMNLLLAVVFSTLYVLNVGFNVPQVRGFLVQAETVGEESAAYMAGLRAGDRIVTVNGGAVRSNGDFNDLFIVGGDNIVEVARAGERALLAVTLTEMDFKLFDKMPAEAAGMLPGDRIIRINGRRMRTHNDFMLYMRYSVDGPLTIEADRDGTRLRFEIEPFYVANAQTFRIGFITDSRLGTFMRVTDENSAFERATFFESLYNGFFDVSYYVRSTLTGLSRLVSRQMGMDEIGGPIMIVGVISSSTEASYQSRGIMGAVWNAVWFAAFISSNLFIINLLPIPALDGGKMMFLTVEAIRGKPLPPEKEGLIHLVGFGLLMVFAVFVAYNDIMRFF